MRHGERNRRKKQAAVVVIMLFEYNLKIIGDLNSIQGLSTSSSFGQHEIDTQKSTNGRAHTDSSTISGVIVFIRITL